MSLEVAAYSFDLPRSPLFFDRPSRQGKRPKYGNWVLQALGEVGAVSVPIRHKTGWIGWPDVASARSEAQSIFNEIALRPIEIEVRNCVDLAAFSLEFSEVCESLIVPVVAVYTRAECAAMVGDRPHVAGPDRLLFINMQYYLEFDSTSQPCVAFIPWRP
jgi:hypothetical protein